MFRTGARTKTQRSSFSTERKLFGMENEVYDGKHVIQGGKCWIMHNEKKCQIVGGKEMVVSGFELMTCTVYWRLLHQVDHRGAAVLHKKCQAGPNFGTFWPTFHQNLFHGSTYNTSGDAVVFLRSHGVVIFQILLKFQTVLASCLFFLGISRNVARVDDKNGVSKFQRLTPRNYHHRTPKHSAIPVSWPSS